MEEKEVREKLKGNYNFLKYWKVIRYWAQRKYNIGTADLDMLLFLYSEGIFKRKDFNRYNIIFKWDKKRFGRLLKEGHIIAWRDKTDPYNKAKLYELSTGAKRMCNSIYKKLLGEEPVSEHRVNNPIFAKASFADKMYRQIIKQMNEENNFRKN